jgi:S-adenosyl-L-methionine hydrolase (adenosine-forming)
LLYYPANTIHFIFVDLFNNPKDELIIYKCRNQYFCTTNNGLMFLLFGQAEAFEAIAFAPPIQNVLFGYFDVFINAVHQIINGTNFTQIGQPLNQLKQLQLPTTQKTEKELIGGILRVDKFGNVVVNIRLQEFTALQNNRAYQIYFGPSQTLQKISSSFADARDSELVAFFNAAGYLEIGIKHGNAAQTLGLQQHVDSNLKPLSFAFTTVSIFFIN